MKENERLKCPYCFFCVEKSQLDPFWYVVLVQSVVSNIYYFFLQWKGLYYTLLLTDIIPILCIKTIIHR
jgi:hypothetical protein